MINCQNAYVTISIRYKSIYILSVKPAPQNHHSPSNSPPISLQRAGCRSTPRRCGTFYVGWVLCSNTWVICSAIFGETSSGKWWRPMGWSEGRFLGKLGDGWVWVWVWDVSFFLGGWMSVNVWWPSTGGGKDELGDEKTGADVNVRLT